VAGLVLKGEIPLDDEMVMEAAPVNIKNPDS
jgi:hypothetical protein